MMVWNLGVFHGRQIFFGRMNILKIKNRSRSNTMLWFRIYIYIALEYFEPKKQPKQNKISATPPCVQAGAT